VQGGVDASAALVAARSERTDDSAPARRIDWRTMLPAVTLRSGA
jgi:hypothetical protein